MGFNIEHYNLIKDFTDQQLNFVDFRLVDKYKNKPFEYAITFLPMISSSIQSEDFEAAKAISDSVREFLNRFLPEKEQIPKNAIINLPKFKQVEIKGIICFTDY